MVNAIRKIFGMIRLNPLDNAGKRCQNAVVKSHRLKHFVPSTKSPPMAGELRVREDRTASMRAAHFSCLRGLFFAHKRRNQGCSVKSHTANNQRVITEDELSDVQADAIIALLHSVLKGRQVMQQIKLCSQFINEAKGLPERGLPVGCGLPVGHLRLVTNSSAENQG